MDVEVDHYTILGLPSGVESSKLSEQEIHRAYRSKARELHPDKRLGDPNAHANFLKLQTSYEVLKDAKARKLCDDLLRLKREKLRHQGRPAPKRQRMKSDLEDRELSSSAADTEREYEVRTVRKLKEEMAEISAMQSSRKKRKSPPVVSVAERSETDYPNPSNLSGAGFRAFEESVLEKLKKAAQRQNGVVIM